MPPTATSFITPVGADSRIEYLDILRGISVLFIFTANIPFFSGWIFIGEEGRLAMSGHVINEIIEMISLILIGGKFYSLFSILFGVGFAIQYMSAQKANKPFVAFFGRRMFGLLLIGSLHLFGLWVGDILTLYALLGFVLIAFRKTRDNTLLIIAVILIIMPVLQWAIMQWTGFFYPYLIIGKFQEIWDSMNLPNRDWNGNGMMSFDPMYMLTSDSLGEWFIINSKWPMVRLALILLEGRMFKVMALFLIGFWAGKQILSNHLLQNVSFLKKVMYFGFALGIPMNIFRYFTESQSGDFWVFMEYFSYAFGVIPMACAYAAAIALWVRRDATRLSGFGHMGRMALTNYLMQTAISITIFYGFGFGLAGKVPLWGVMIIMLAIFSFQIMFSKFWLSKFRFGPIEWIWRQMTYGKIISLRKPS
ncbi:MAG: hypothetical protein ACJA08_001265 [Cyclobacteriaceae bacterium]|jgi:uncharacterized protein